MPGEGEYVATELFYMQVGTLRLRRRWIDPDAVLRGQIFLTALSAVALLSCGFILGWLAATGFGGRNPHEFLDAKVSFGRVGSDLDYAPSAELLSSSSSPWPSWLYDMNWREGEARDAVELGGAGRRCDCDCTGRMDDLLRMVNGADLALESLGNVSSLY